VQHDLEQLIQSNKQLQIEVDQWRAWYKTQTNRAPAQASVPAVQPIQTTTQMVEPIQPVVAQTVRTNPPGLTPGGARVSPRGATVRTTYIVQSRDTLASISRKFNVKLDSLIAANPGLDARKLRPGQTVNIP
jgi:LysM repeat protein